MFLRYLLDKVSDARILFLLINILYFSLSAQTEELLLRDNLKRAVSGDYMVISVNKTETLLFMKQKQGDILTIEEVAVPEGKRPGGMPWKEWIANKAPGNTSWVMYDIDLRNGQMLHYYSYTKRNWFEIPDQDNFLSKLLNLKLTKMPDSARKRVGPKSASGPDVRPLWQPRMIVDGQVLTGVLFDAWRTKWPRDGSDLSGKSVEVYLPKDSLRYPSYFPYWLQVNGAVGKAKIRIIDSGSAMKSPAVIAYEKN